ncbi:MAG TPA: ACT domain-containing protein [Planctomycetes bacterium]|nr:ACT domain-containing protein [Planctomycetota bacterium]HIL37718.1 ACT domain-containing protein [Planctomycetota bacterium]
MAWELVGFLAHITGALAAAGISIGAVCGFSRDHLFVPQELSSEALRILADMGIRAVPLNASHGDGSACCD